MTIATQFALCTIPMALMIGGGIDYTNASQHKAALQAKADASALAATDGVWIDATTYRVTKEEPFQLAFGPLFGLETWNISVESEAIHTKPVEVYKAPAVMQLDPEAGDYNRVGVYCFDPVSKKRGEVVDIADNAGSTFSTPVPECKGGEVRHQRLTNVRDARGNPKLWNAGGDRYTYHGDNLTAPILETVLCPTLAKCKGKSKGGVIPEGKNRNPQKAGSACPKGQFMYYGYEDRPSGGDRDFDDIRIILSCPETETKGTRTVRLSK